MHNVSETLEKINSLSWKAALKAKYSHAVHNRAQSTDLPRPIPNDKASAIAQ